MFAENSPRPVSPALNMIKFEKEPTPDFYPATVRKILPFCGNEYSTSDFHSAVKYLNSQLHLNLNEQESTALGLLLTGLSQTTRFRGSLYLTPELGENSAVHSMHTAVLVNELFRRAELLKPEAQTPEVASMRVEITLASILHDMGEMLGELSSVDERVRDKSLSERPDIERKIFESVTRLAFEAAYSGDHSYFYQQLHEMRKAVKTGSPAGPDLSNLDMVLKQYGSDFPGQDGSPINAAAEAQVQQFLQLFDMAESDDKSGRDKTSLFRGYVVKAVEHMQGTRHLTRFGKKDDNYKELRLFSPRSSRYTAPAVPWRYDEPEKELTLPLSLAESARMTGSLKYVEGEVGHVLALAETEAEKALAEAVRRAQYETIIEMLNASSPVIDLSSDRSHPVVTRLVGSLKDPGMRFDVKRERVQLAGALIKELQLELMTKLDTSGEEFGPVVTRERLMDLYYHALQSGYHPKPGEILALNKELPEELKDFPEQDWDKIREESLREAL
ncbi:MAG: hypothetical protein D6719_13270 [Candidatus Dadabacteria bacterium]|nr:MAG: hypothetical protein D6719_13270 [Candidatus Dadabacteria bacterium]